MSDWLTSFPGVQQVFSVAKKVVGRILRSGQAPKHVGIIMDGNRRFALNHKIEIKEGHNLGFQSMANVLELLYESGVQSSTVFAFSIENFKRLKYEVKWLMELATQKLTQISQRGDLCDKYGVKVRVIGNISYVPADLQKAISVVEEQTKNNTRAVLNICFPYTSRDEMTHLIKNLVQESLSNDELSIDELSIEDNLFTFDQPPLDLLIRTSGACRLSDFMLWQCVSHKCSVVFTDKLWPEFNPLDMTKILLNYEFNTYWYGFGNGLTTSNTSRTTAEGSHLDLRRFGTTMFEEYDDGYEEDIDEDRESYFATDEADTMTSIEAITTKSSE